jgi:hypothetical protein
MLATLSGFIKCENRFDFRMDASTLILLVLSIVTVTNLLNFYMFLLNPCSTYIKACTKGPIVKSRASTQPSGSTWCIKVLQYVSDGLRFESTRLQASSLVCRVHNQFSHPLVHSKALFDCAATPGGFQRQVQLGIFHWTSVTIPFYT